MDRLIDRMQLTEQQRLCRAQTFAELYDQGRREPPDWLFRDLFAASGLDPASNNVLEIGCGTGKSTAPLARRGRRVLALEMGGNLVRIARRNLAEFPRVRIVKARFEEWRRRSGNRIQQSPTGPEQMR